MKNLLLSLFSLGTILSAAPITYTINVNTSSLAGQMGNLDFQFNPGPGPVVPASAVISMFSPGAALIAPPVLTGAASGTLPGSVTLMNTTVFNDYAERITFGSSLSFQATFNGTGVSSFAFSLFDSAFTTPLLTTDPAGFLVIANLDAAGNITTSTTSAAATITAPVPEPATTGLALLGLGFVGIRSLWYRLRHCE